MALRKGLANQIDGIPGVQGSWTGTFHRAEIFPNVSSVAVCRLQSTLRAVACTAVAVGSRGCLLVSVPSIVQVLLTLLLKYLSTYPRVPTLGPVPLRLYPGLSSAQEQRRQDTKSVLLLGKRETRLLATTNTGQYQPTRSGHWAAVTSASR